MAKPAPVPVINVTCFLVAFSVGLLLVYLSHPKPKLVVKFPSPYNAGQILYRDDADMCFRYRAEKVACPQDRGGGVVRDQPILENFRNKSPYPGNAPLAPPATM